MFIPSFQFNISHHINHLSFGIDYPGIVNPLDGMHEPALKCKCCAHWTSKKMPNKVLIKILLQNIKLIKVSEVLHLHG